MVVLSAVDRRGKRRTCEQKRPLEARGGPVGRSPVTPVQSLWAHTRRRRRAATTSSGGSSLHPHEQTQRKGPAVVDRDLEPWPPVAPNGAPPRALDWPVAEGIYKRNDTGRDSSGRK